MSLIEQIIYLATAVRDDVNIDLVRRDIIKCKSRHSIYHSAIFGRHQTGQFLWLFSKTFFHFLPIICIFRRSLEVTKCLALFVPPAATGPLSENFPFLIFLCPFPES